MRERPEQLRKKILDAARALFFKHGVDGVSARKIASRAGCSATAIYLYYDSIEHVLHELRMEGHALLARHFRASDRVTPTIARIEAMGRAYYRFGVENPGYYNLMFLTRGRQPRRREEIQQEMYTLMLVRDVVVGGVERGELRADLDVMVTTNALWAVVHGVTSLAVQGLLFETARGQHQEVLEQILKSIARALAK